MLFFIGTGLAAGAITGVLIAFIVRLYNRKKRNIKGKHFSSMNQYSKIRADARILDATKRDKSSNSFK